MNLQSRLAELLMQLDRLILSYEHQIEVLKQENERLRKSMEEKNND